MTWNTDSTPPCGMIRDPDVDEYAEEIGIIMQSMSS
jgi:hypothetical protein